MNSNFFLQIPSYILVLIIFFLIILFNWWGFRYKKKQLQKYPGQVPENMGAVEGSILGVLSLLMGFTFSLAVGKFETQRELTTEEANDIGTAILRCDMYPDSVRSPLRADFKEYVEARLDYYTAGNDLEKINQSMVKAAEISDRIWKRAALQSQDRENIVRSAQMIPALNSMIDIVTTRDAGRISRVPQLILWILLFLVLVSSFILGTDYNGKRRNKTLILGYAIVTTLTLGLINELNRPRRGLINLDAVEQKMTDLKEMVK